MNKTYQLAATSLFLLAAACTDNAADKTDKQPTTTGAVSPVPVAPANPAMEAKPVDTKPTALVALAKPASTWTVGGRTISLVTDDELLAAARKDALVPVKDTTTKVTDLVAGQYETKSLPIQKGAMKGNIRLVRPAATPGTPDSLANSVVPSKLGDTMNKDNSAYTYDADSDTFLSVELAEGGKAADAKKILDGFAIQVKGAQSGDQAGVVTGAPGTMNGASGEAMAAPGTAGAKGTAGANGATATGTATGTATNNGSGNTKDSNAVLPAANGKANSAARNPEKDSNSIPPKRESK